MSTNPFRLGLRSFVRPHTSGGSLSLSLVTPRFTSTGTHHVQIQARSIHTSLTRNLPGSSPPSSPTLMPHPPHAHPHGHTNAHSHGHANPNTNTHGQGGGKKRSPHMVWYREIVPAMVPIFLISTTLFLSLSLVRTHLSHSKSLSESTGRIEELEAQLSRLRAEQKRARVREKKERERLLPIVVERVLQRVGVVGGEDDDGDEADDEADTASLTRATEKMEKELPRLL